MLSRVCLVFVALLSMAAPAAGENRTASSAKMTTYADPDNSLQGMDFVFVPGGCFRMGSYNGNSNEMPVHEVCVSDFFIGKFEVTQGQWRKIMGNNPARFIGCGDDCPVEQVSWPDTQEFIRRLSNLTGRKYRLPTEAEWEYACRGGGRDDIYCGGNDIDRLAWHEGNSGGKIHPVGKKLPNSLAIHDMSGNVWEWVQDFWGDYRAERQIDPIGPGYSSNSVRRGGSWQYGPNHSRAAWRSNGYTDDHALDIGFRLVSPAIK